MFSFLIATKVQKNKYLQTKGYNLSNKECSMMQQLGEELRATKRAYVVRNDLYCLTLSFMFHFSL